MARIEQYEPLYLDLLKVVGKKHHLPQMVVKNSILPWYKRNHLKQIQVYHVFLTCSLNPEDLYRCVLSEMD